MNSRLLAACVGAIALVGALVLCLPAQSDEDPWSAASVRARFADPDADAKPEVFGDNLECKGCHGKDSHDDRVKSLSTSFHAKFVDAAKSKSHGCQECHGPGAEHIDDDELPMRDPSYTADVLAEPATAPAAEPASAPKEDAKPRRHETVPVREMNGVCLRCHLDVLTKPVLEHRAWTTKKGAAPAADRSCVSCHSVHVDSSSPAFDKKAKPPATAAELAKTAPQVDPKQCVACHSQFDKPVFHPQMARSGHAFLMKDDDELHGCAACHGPGGLHAISGGRPAKIVNPKLQKAADVDATCNACHIKGKSVERWTCSEHSRQGVSCIVCHDANAPSGHTLRKPEFQLCGSCHLDVQAQFRMPNRHRVAEGRIACSDCHDPHGNTDRVRDKDVRYRACLACHQEKGGPFLFDHGIKRGEGCVACHDPHGSTNVRMLTYPRVQPMCLQCHPETEHDLAKPKFKNCIGCHTEIHGSNLDRWFLK
jgi:DmsE family decaheme c-type cytochrome